MSEGYRGRDSGRGRKKPTSTAKSFAAYKGGSKPNKKYAHEQKPFKNREDDSFKSRDRPKFHGSRSQDSRSSDSRDSRPPSHSQGRDYRSSRTQRPAQSRDVESKPREYQRVPKRESEFKSRSEQRSSPSSKPPFKKSTYNSKKEFVPNIDRKPFGEHRLKGIFTIKGSLATQNAIPGQSVYGERLTKWDGVEYRIWEPKRSKLGAAITKGISQIGIKPGSKVLYLGCSTGTTVSHVGEIVGDEGRVYALDHAPRVMRDLLFNTAKRKNIFPIMGDASKPQDYAHLLEEVDVVFMDISQRNQSEIFLKNCKAFLVEGGFGLLALKSRSVDITQSPHKIYAKTRFDLEKHMTIVDYKELDPYEIDHAFFVVKK